MTQDTTHDWESAFVGVELLIRELEYKIQPETSQTEEAKTRVQHFEQSEFVRLLK